MKDRTLTQEETEMEDHLLMLLEDPEFPEPKNVNFELWEYDGSIKTLFLMTCDKFTEEHRFYIKNKLRKFFSRKLVIGVIRAESLF